MVAGLQHHDGVCAQIETVIWAVGYVHTGAKAGKQPLDPVPNRAKQLVVGASHYPICGVIEGTDRAVAMVGTGAIPV
ncbi:hypothetical protein D3C80_1731790 [compost metagenome]